MVHGGATLLLRAFRTGTSATALIKRPLTQRRLRIALQSNGLYLSGVIRLGQVALSWVSPDVCPHSSAGRQCVYRTQCRPMLEPAGLRSRAVMILCHYCCCLIDKILTFILTIYIFSCIFTYYFLDFFQRNFQKFPAQ